MYSFFEWTVVGPRNVTSEESLMRLTQPVEEITRFISSSWSVLLASRAIRNKCFESPEHLLYRDMRSSMKIDRGVPCKPRVRIASVWWEVQVADPDVVGSCKQHRYPAMIDTVYSALREMWCPTHRPHDRGSSSFDRILGWRVRVRVRVPQLFVERHPEVPTWLAEFAVKDPCYVPASWWLSSSI